MTVNCEATAYRDIFFFGLQKSPLSQHQRTIEDTKRLVTIKCMMEEPENKVKTSCEEKDAMSTGKVVSSNDESSASRCYATDFNTNSSISGGSDDLGDVSSDKAVCEQRNHIPEKEKVKFLRTFLNELTKGVDKVDAEARMERKRKIRSESAKRKRIRTKQQLQHLTLRVVILKNQISSLRAEQKKLTALAKSEEEKRARYIVGDFEPLKNASTVTASTKWESKPPPPQAPQRSLQAQRVLPQAVMARAASTNVVVPSTQVRPSTVQAPGDLNQALALLQSRAQQSQRSGSASQPPRGSTSVPCPPRQVQATRSVESVPSVSAAQVLQLMSVLNKQVNSIKTLQGTIDQLGCLMGRSPNSLRASQLSGGAASSGTQATAASHAALLGHAQQQSLNPFPNGSLPGLTTTRRTAPQPAPTATRSTHGGSVRTQHHQQAVVLALVAALAAKGSARGQNQR